MRAYKSLIIVFLLCILSDMMMYFSFWIEFCNTYIFKYWAFIFSLSLGIIPFSVGDVLYSCFIMLCTFYIIKIITSIFQKKWNLSLKYLRKISFMVCLFYLCLNILWNFNYYKPSIIEKMNLKANPYSTKELISLNKYLITKTNFYRNKIVEDKNKVANSNATIEKLIIQGDSGIFQLNKKYNLNFFTAKKINVKPMIFPTLYNYFGITGYFIPFTSEANINTKIPKTSLPFTIVHEIAHQYGIASESQANFISFLTGIHHSNNFYKYSAYFNAMKYSLAELSYRDYKTFKNMIKSINSNVKRDLEHHRKHYEKYENPLFKYIDSLFNQAYDSYLKSQNQTHGIQSYNYVVALIISLQLHSSPI